MLISKRTNDQLHCRTGGKNNFSTYTSTTYLASFFSNHIYSTMSKANGGNDTAIASLSLCLQCYTDKATDPTIKEPLYGFWPRKVKGEQVRRVLVSFFLPFITVVLFHWKLYLGRWCQPVHETTALCGIQENCRDEEKVARVCSDGWILQNGAPYNDLIHWILLTDGIDAIVQW